MALNDIVFDNNVKDFVVEVPVGALNSPKDILFDANSSKFPVEEIDAIQISYGSVF